MCNLVMPNKYNLQTQEAGDMWLAEKWEGGGNTTVMKSDNRKVTFWNKNWYHEKWHDIKSGMK